MRCKDMRALGIMPAHKNIWSRVTERRREIEALRKSQAPLVEARRLAEQLAQLAATPPPPATAQVVERHRRIRFTRPEPTPPAVQLVLPYASSDCYWCGLPFSLSSEPLMRTKEHVTPRHAGGPDATWNIAHSHKLCNNRRGHDLTWIPFEQHGVRGHLYRRSNTGLERLR